MLIVKYRNIHLLTIKDVFELCLADYRIDVQGLGEAAPAVQGSDDDARARNRRAVILEQK